MALHLTSGWLAHMAKRGAGNWLSVVEAARVLGISRPAIYQAIEEGRLKARQRKLLIRRPTMIDE